MADKILEAVETVARMDKVSQQKFTSALTERFPNLAESLISNLQSDLQTEQHRQWEEAK
jgi:hypothetical protein